MALALLLVTAAFLLDRGLAAMLRPRATGPVKPAAAHHPVPPQGVVVKGLTGLTAGTCLSFAPAGKDRRQTVFIDAGHGGLDPGVVGRTSAGSTISEKTATLEVALALAARLRTAGYRVVLSRTADTTLIGAGADGTGNGVLTREALRQDLIARVDCANAAGADVLLAIHFNAYDGLSAGGTETYYDSARAFNQQNARLAKAVQAQLVAGLGLPDRGALSEASLNVPTVDAAAESYGHLVELGPAQQGWLERPSRMPGALTEPLFLTNPQQADLAASPWGQRRIAAALKAALDAYFAGG